PGKEPDAPGFRRFLTALEEELQAETDTHDGASSSRGLGDGGAQTRHGKGSGGLPEVAHAGHEHPLRGPHLIGVGGQHGLVARRREGAHHALQVVHPVIDHGDHSVPLVDGTPVTRGSRVVAASSARANALNAASTIWCGLSPRIKSRWAVSPAFSTSARKNSGVRKTS